VHHNLYVDYVSVPGKCMMKRQMNLKNYEIQSRTDTHINVGFIEIVEVGSNSSSKIANIDNNKNSILSIIITTCWVLDISQNGEVSGYV
jgi:hypothetical protein